MKSKKAKELMEMLESQVRFIDLPRRFTEREVQKLIEIAEIEILGDDELLGEKVKEFSNSYK